MNVKGVEVDVRPMIRVERYSARELRKASVWRSDGHCGSDGNGYVGGCGDGSRVKLQSLTQR